MNSIISLKTGVWYGDRQINLPIPSSWDVKVLWPATPPPLTAEELLSTLEHPIGKARLTEVCRKKSRPLILVDDLNRPTPTAEIMPHLLKMMSTVGIPSEAIKILMATGTHGQPEPDAVLKKVDAAFANDQLQVHNCFADTIKIGVTSSGIPVFVNKIVMESDVVIGISGIYPNHTAGFGGGSKLALGVLGIQTIYHLHFRHKSAGWGNFFPEMGFRRDLDEIARMIGMEFNISLIIDANRQIVRMYCGDPIAYFPRAVLYYQQVFRTQLPGDADVVISNAYPNDCSLTFTRMKGFVPLALCTPAATRIAISACPEGLGLHNIWPFVNVPPRHRLKHILRVLSVLTLKEILVRGFRTAISPLTKRLTNRQKSGNLKALQSVWLYQTCGSEINLPANVPGIHITSDWQKILEAVLREQSNRNQLKVLVYPCAFLQLFE